MEVLVDSCLVVIGSDCIVLQYFIATLMFIKAF